MGVKAMEKECPSVCVCVCVCVRVCVRGRYSAGGKVKRIKTKRGRIKSRGGSWVMLPYVIYRSALCAVCVFLGS